MKEGDDLVERMERREVGFGGMVPSTETRTPSPKQRLCGEG